MRIKLIIGTDFQDLEKSLNSFLDSIGDIKADIKYELDKNIAIIEYDEKKESVKQICCDCQFYDPTGDYRGAWGVCQRKGVRTRFSMDRCDYFLDLRV